MEIPENNDRTIFRLEPGMRKYYTQEASWDLEYFADSTLDDASYFFVERGNIIEVIEKAPGNNPDYVKVNIISSDGKIIHANVFISAIFDEPNEKNDELWADDRRHGSDLGEERKSDLRNPEANVSLRTTDSQDQVRELMLEAFQSTE